MSDPTPTPPTPTPAFGVRGAGGQEEPSPWMPPPSGWIPSNTGGAGAGYGPPGGAGGSGDGGSRGGGGGGTAGGSGRPNQPVRRMLLVLAAAVVLAGVATAGVLIGEGQRPAQQSTNATIASPPRGAQSNNNVPGGKLNVASVAARLDPAVVDITSVVGTTGEEAGTGMILTPTGDVLTNNHVVEGATSITAQIDGTGPKYGVRVLGTDITQDVALLQLEGVSGLPTVSIGNSATLAVGDPVVAIGNALDLKGPPTVTAGTISALGRSIEASDEGTDATEHLTGLIQTDAPINPGNSGGPLANAAGQVIGMNTAASEANQTQADTNIGFAIPINEAISIAQQIEQHKSSSLVHIAADAKGYIGVDVESVSTIESSGGAVDPYTGAPLPAPGTQHGAYIVGVVQPSAATSAGLQPGDVITGVNGHAITSAADLGSTLRDDHPGTAISLTWVSPSGTSHTATVHLGSGPTP